MLLSAFFGVVPARLTNTQRDMPYSGGSAELLHFSHFSESFVLRRACHSLPFLLRLLTRNEYGFPFNYNSMAHTEGPPITFLSAAVCHLAYLCPQLFLAKSLR